MEPRSLRRAATRSIAGFAAAALALACSPDTSGLSPLAQQGQRVYMNVCIACHNGVPSQDGAVGPAIAGSPRELVEAKVLRAEYPPGYTPKRPGGVAMPKFEYLAPEIDALTGFLAEAGDHR
jgi:mono/diheme cytochrome c family protein